VQYALLIGLLAALFETIPYAGPILTAVIAILLAFLQTGGWIKPVLVLILFLVIQRIENDLLVPKIMQKAVGLNPIISIVSLLVGFRLLGVLGAILAIPVMAVVSIVWLDFIEWHQKKTDI
jgi:predicted PurR-regulated permease PerM